MMMTRFASIAAVLAIFTGCGPPPPVPPEGFTLAVRFDSIDIAVLESVRIRIHPPLTTRFAAVPDTEYESGAIRLTQDTDSSLLFEITGAHVRDRATQSPDGPSMVYELQIWSDDPGMMMFGDPLVLGTAFRSGGAIGEGTVYLPGWPPPIEEEIDGEVVCTQAGASPGEPTPPCRALLPIVCTADAANMGLCFP